MGYLAGQSPWPPHLEFFHFAIDNLTTGIWIGFDDNKETELSSGDAAYIWKKFIANIYNLRIE